MQVLFTPFLDFFLPISYLLDTRYYPSTIQYLSNTYLLATYLLAISY
nr:MAG TPA: hypothetical protein [Caudoviricetes sp.]